jgi:protein tyrosine phosphatase
MPKKSILFHLIISIVFFSLNAGQLINLPVSSPISSQQAFGEQVSSAKEQIEHRWKSFQLNREFKKFEIGRSDVSLKEEFEEIRKTRDLIYTTPMYEEALHLISKDLVRAPSCIAFDFNNTSPIYNASTMYFGDRYYIACEGPRSKDVFSFFTLLVTHQVTHLVRLTASCEGEIKKCHPYWEGLLTEASNGAKLLNIATKTGVFSLRTFDMAYWRDNQSVDPDKLLALVLQIRQDLRDTNGLLVVHCSAGVGRTGTFLAALAIVDAIDKKTSFSIEEIVYRLSLQRVHCVGKFCQYILLHRLAENYLKQKT